MAVHPAVVMSKARADAWRDQAQDEDFYKQLEDLAVIYAGRHRKSDGKLDETKLFVDFKRWKDGRARDILSQSSAQG